LATAAALALETVIVIYDAAEHVAAANRPNGRVAREWGWIPLIKALMGRRSL
jgi:hypothetical protein